tara:strand:+ start:56 stop:181 length:126 start_codon:yes stop_codon:yes gene_type:complete
VQTPVQKGFVFMCRVPLNWFAEDNSAKPVDKNKTSGYPNFF